MLVPEITCSFIFSEKEHFFNGSFDYSSICLIGVLKIALTDLRKSNLENGIQFRMYSRVKSLSTVTARLRLSASMHLESTGPISGYCGWLLKLQRECVTSCFSCIN